MKRNTALLLAAILFLFGLSGCVLGYRGIKFHVVIRNLTDEELILHIQEQDNIKNIRRITTGPANTKLTFLKIKNLPDTIEVQRINSSNLKIVVPAHSMVNINGILPLGPYESTRVLRLLNSNLQLIDSVNLRHRHTSDFFEEKGNLYKSSLQIRDINPNDL